MLVAFTVAVAASHGALAEDTVEDVNRQCGAEYADPLALTKCLKAEEKDYGKKLTETYRESGGAADAGHARKRSSRRSARG